MLKSFVIQLWNTTKISLSNLSKHTTANGRSFANCSIGVVATGSLSSAYRGPRPAVEVALAVGAAGLRCVWWGVKPPSGNRSQE